MGVGLLSFILVAGCNHSGTSPAADPSSAHGSAAAGAASLPTPHACEKYVAALCEKTGKESDTCRAMGISADVLPPAACSAGLNDLAYSFRKLAEESKSCDELTAKLCAETGPTSTSCDLVKSQSKQLAPERCKIMLDHVPEIVADLKKMEEASRPLSAEVVAALARGKAPSFGPENAKVTVIEFADFQCPYCAKAAEVVEQVREKYQDRVHFVFRQFPLSMHENARGAAEAALAANAQGNFWKFHDKLFQNQGKLTREGLEGLAKEVGLNLPKFKKALDEKTYAADVDSDVKLGDSALVQGTPTLIINGVRVPNPTSFEDVSAQIESALKGGSVATPGGNAG